MKKIIFIIIGAVILAALAFVFLSDRRKNPNPSQNPAENQNLLPAHSTAGDFQNIRPESDTSNWKTYRNEKYGFEIKYPNNLYPETPSPINNYLLYVRFTKGESEMPVIPPIMMIVKKCEGNIKSCALDPLASAEFKVFSLDKVEIHQYYTSGWGGRIYINGILQKNNFAYNVVVESSRELPDLPTPEDIIYFKKILSTFKFIK